MPADTAARRLPRGRPLTGYEVEVAVLDSILEAEDAAEDLEVRLRAKAATESTYRRAKAHATLRTAAKTDAARDAYAIESVGDLLDRRDLADALAAAQAEVCRVRRAAIEGLRSLLVSARAAQEGRG